MFYLLWGNLQVAWAYYISAVMTNMQAAVIWAVSINIFSGLIANLVMVRARTARQAELPLGPIMLAMHGLHVCLCLLTCSVHYIGCMKHMSMARFHTATLHHSKDAQT